MRPGSFPPGRSLGFKSAKMKMQPRSKITMFLQSKASDKIEEFVVVVVVDDDDDDDDDDERDVFAKCASCC